MLIVANRLVVLLSAPVLRPMVWPLSGSDARLGADSKGTQGNCEYCGS
jgi:hypothetical protein